MNVYEKRIRGELSQQVSMESHITKILDRIPEIFFWAICGITKCRGTNPAVKLKDGETLHEKETRFILQKYKLQWNEIETSAVA
jgi:hypothetical protein